MYQRERLPSMPEQVATSPERPFTTELPAAQAGKNNLTGMGYVKHTT